MKWQSHCRRSHSRDSSQTASSTNRSRLCGNGQLVNACRSCFRWWIALQKNTLCLCSAFKAINGCHIHSYFYWIRIWIYMEYEGNLRKAHSRQRLLFDNGSQFGRGQSALSHWWLQPMILVCSLFFFSEVRFASFSLCPSDRFPWLDITKKIAAAASCVIVSVVLSKSKIKYEMLMVMEALKLQSIKEVHCVWPLSVYYGPLNNMLFFLVSSCSSDEFCCWFCYCVSFGVLFKIQQMKFIFGFWLGRQAAAAVAFSECVQSS